MGFYESSTAVVARRIEVQTLAYLVGSPSGSLILLGASDSMLSSKYSCAADGEAEGDAEGAADGAEDGAAEGVVRATARRPNRLCFAGLCSSRSNAVVESPRSGPAQFNRDGS